MIKLKLYGCKDITKCPVPGCEKTARNDKIIEHQMELVMFNDDDQAASEENPRFKDLSNAGKNMDCMCEMFRPNELDKEGSYHLVEPRRILQALETMEELVENIYIWGKKLLVGMADNFISGSKGHVTMAQLEL